MSKTKSTKKKNIFLSHKGVLIFVLSLVLSTIDCVVVFRFKQEILNLDVVRAFSNCIEEIAVLSVVTAINICVTTTLTLSLTIEGNKNSLKFGLTPKELNEYLGLPISLNSSYIGLVIYFVGSLCTISLKEILIFYLLSMLSLGYFLICIIVGVPVLKGNNKSAYKQLEKNLDDVNVNNIENSKTGFILKYLFSKGISVEELYFKIHKKSRKNSLSEDINIISSILLYLSYYLRNPSTPIDIITIHWNYFKEHFLSFFKKEDDSLFSECKDDLYRCLYFIYLRKELTNTIADDLCYLSIEHQSFIHNNNNKELIKYLFIRFTSYSLQNNDFTFFTRIERQICKFEFGAIYDKEGRFNFLLISFLLYCYSIDPKVPSEIKNNIKALLTEADTDPRFTSYSWGSTLFKIVENNFDLEKDVFTKTIDEYKDWFEYTVYGKVFSPAVKNESAYEWYWCLLLISDRECEVFDYFDNKSEFETYLFTKFYDDIETGNTEKYKRIIDIYGEKAYRFYCFEFDEELKSKIDIAILEGKKEKLNTEIDNNSTDSISIINKCNAAILDEITKYAIDDNKDHRPNQNITFHVLYDNHFELDLNIKNILYSSDYFFRDYVFKSLKIRMLTSDDDYSVILKPVFRI